MTITLNSTYVMIAFFFWYYFFFILTTWTYIVSDHRLRALMILLILRFVYCWGTVLSDNFFLCFGFYLFFSWIGVDDPIIFVFGTFHSSDCVSSGRALDNSNRLWGYNFSSFISCFSFWSSVFWNLMEYSDLFFCRVSAWVFRIGVLLLRFNIERILMYHEEWMRFELGDRFFTDYFASGCKLFQFFLDTKHL